MFESQEKKIPIEMLKADIDFLHSTSGHLIPE
jgi:hypothetical protein